MFMPNAKSFRPFEAIALSANGLSLIPQGQAQGMLATSLVETPEGWRPVGTLMRGALVETWDGDLAEVLRVDRHHYWPSEAGAMIHVPAAAMQGCSDLWLMPEQMIMLRSPLIRDVLGAEGTLVRAADMVGFRGTNRQALTRPAEMVSLRFAQEELAYVNSAALVLCPAMVPDAPTLDCSLPVLQGSCAKAMLELVAAGARSSDDVRHAA